MGAQIEATSMHFNFYPQTLTVCSGLLVRRTRRNGWPGSNDALSIINLMLPLIISKKRSAKRELHKSVNHWA